MDAERPVVLGPSLAGGGGPTYMSLSRSFVPESAKRAATGFLYTHEAAQQGDGPQTARGARAAARAHMRAAPPFPRRPSPHTQKTQHTCAPQFHLVPHLGLPYGHGDALYFTGQLEEANPPGSAGAGAGGDAECVAIYDEPRGEWRLELLTYKLAARCALRCAVRAALRARARAHAAQRARMHAAPAPARPPRRAARAQAAARPGAGVAVSRGAGAAAGAGAGPSARGARGGAAAGTGVAPLVRLPC